MARDYPLAAFAARGKPHAKLILTRHVLFPLKRFQSRVFSRASRVIAVSEAVARQLKAQQLLQPERISVVRNGVDVERLNEARRTSNRAALCRGWGFPENCLLVGTVGELNPLKGHDVFIQAAANVVASHPQARFLIVGGDSSSGNKTLNALKDLIAGLSLSDRIRMVGEVEDVAPFLAAMDVFVSASQTESFGLAMVEALASSVPVVATNTEGAQEIIKDAETGFLVPIGQSQTLAESINRLLADAALRERMGQLAYQDASERFRLEQMVEAIEQIYEES
jgi:glycosyltransferase involved in cell wall biosynthesis